MARDRYYVLDANVVVSAVLLPDSVPRQAFDRACARGRILLSVPVINELDDVLRRPKLNRYIHEDERILFLVSLTRESKVVQTTEAISECRDPKDNKYLELAVAGDAVCIISGDQDLLVLSPFRGIPILTPRGFLDGDL